LSLARWQWNRGNLVNVVSSGRRAAKNLSHPIQRRGGVHHLTITIDDPEQANGIVSMLGLA
jgi:hypothetical protein